MKKTIQITILLLFSAIALVAQSEETKEADALFYDLLYAKAAKKYEVLLKKNESAYILKKLGDCYYNNVQMKKASEVYRKLFKLYIPENPEYYFKYAQTLRAEGRFKKSKLWLKKFNELKKEDSRGNNFINKQADVSKLTEGMPNYKVQNLKSINTKFADFGVTEFNNSILFSSPRRLSTSKSSVETGTEDNFLDLYQVQTNQLQYKKPRRKEFSKKINQKYNESSVSFSPDKQTVYFTRNNFNNGVFNVDNKGYNNLKIYKANLVDGKWKNIKELPFCSNNYSVGHPSVSKDGKRLYFTSDMPGSIGATDLYVVTINADESFGTPLNLGTKINTEGREMFPFIAEDNTLYFSSDGHFGIGALDIFASKNEKGKFQTPVNLKAPVNSKLDDFSFSINTTTKKGYLSSNREGGFGNDDIYKLENIQVLDTICNQVVTGIVREAKFKKHLPFAKLTLKDTIGNVVKDTIADALGKFTFKLPCNQKYAITASKEYYTPDTKFFVTTDKVAVELLLDFSLEIINDFVYNESDELIIKINSIYFDYNKWKIRPDAEVELNHIVDVMNRFPEIKVKSTSHTDARGRASYNELLSQRRAESTADYLIYKGISTERISWKGYGESKLTNNCVDNDNHTNKVKCTETQHQANRRTSFVILNVDGTKITSKEKELYNSFVKKQQQESEEQEEVEVTSTPKKHIVTEAETLYSISKKYNILVKILKEINNLTSNNVYLNQVLLLDKETTKNNNQEIKNTHVVAPKETLYAISIKYKITLKKLKQLNNLTSNTIEIGQVLKIK